MRTNTLRTSAWLLTLAALVVLAAGCAGAGAAVPDGFAVVAGDGFALAYPDSWEVVTESTSRAVVADAPATGDLRPMASATLDQRFRGDFDAAVTALDDQARLLQHTDRQVLERRDVAIDGAVRATLLDVRRTEVTPEGEVPVRQYDVFTLDADGRFVYLAINAAEADFDQALADRIVAAFSRADAA